MAGCLSTCLAMPTVDDPHQGFVGAAARYGTSLWLGTADSGLPAATLMVNLLGCLLLGVLLEALGRRGPETPRVRAVRLAVGTGVIGGFTTVSSLVEEVAALVGDGAVGVAVLYSGVSVVGGLLAAVAGIALATWLPRRSGRGPVSGRGRVLRRLHLSTAMVESVRLAQHGRVGPAVADAVLPLTVSVLAAAGGLALAALL